MAEVGWNQLSRQLAHLKYHCDWCLKLFMLPFSPGGLFDLIAEDVQLNVVVENTVAANAEVKVMVKAKQGSGLIGLM